MYTGVAEPGNGGRDIIKLTSSKLSTDEVSFSAVCPECGAVSLFVGTTRNSYQGKVVVQLEYEAYIPMAESELKKICTEMRKKWPTLKHIVVHHRLGLVPVMEASVIIGISSPHRTESLEAVKYCIDALKSTVPIWKKEIYETQEFTWKENKECFWTDNEVTVEHKREGN
ncbi:molybdopterin synthase catalytic subunit [Polypterus senegalus]|nr:molybdopterin synthase catalytic subunit [Polypterus senegalus]